MKTHRAMSQQTNPEKRRFTTVFVHLFEIVIDSTQNYSESSSRSFNRKASLDIVYRSSTKNYTQKCINANKSEKFSAHIKGNFPYLHFEIEVKHEMTLSFREREKEGRKCVEKSPRIIDTSESVAKRFDQQIIAQIR
jgi:hypothetical protein